jgi:hypothetical protein
MRPGARVAPGARRTVLYRKCAETAQLDAVTARKCGDDFIENGVDDVLDIPLIQVRVVLGDALDEFGFDHLTRDRWAWGRHFRENALNCQDAKSISATAKSRDKPPKRHYDNAGNAAQYGEKRI